MPTISTLPVRMMNCHPRKRVAAYARVSIDTEMLLHSLSAQVNHYSQLIQANPEWDFAGVYADDGVTGTSTSHREGFNRLIADCNAGKVDVILTKSISRFARDTVDCLRAVRHLKEIGVEVRFEREDISTFSSDGELLLTLLASFAQAESESISANVRWATRKRFEQGIPNGHKAPYGYEWDGEMFRIIPEQGEIVKDIFRRYIAGESGYGIAKGLKIQGVVGQSGVSMCDSTIRGIISNISYTGTMILQKNYFTEGHRRRRNKGELTRYAVDKMFEPLISVDDFERAQAIRQQRASRIANVSPTLTRFSGLIKCGGCGHGVSRRTTKTNKRWVCNTRERHGDVACDMRPIAESELEAAARYAVGMIDDAEFRQQVQQIIIYGDCIEFRMVNSKTKSVVRKYGGYRIRSGFTGRLICGECGAKLGRDTWKKRDGTKVQSWGCTTPRCSCSLKCLKEAELRKATATILNTNDYEPAFVNMVRQAVITNTSIDYEFKDGTVKTWHRE